MKKIFLSVIFLGAVFNLTAQVSAPYNNLEKYWYYRYRLINDFMKIGPNAGESIPANHRNIGPENTPSNEWDVGNLYWGDATVDLGNYISMLATEYHQLSNNSKSTSRTLWELQYAIDAFYRLDNNAEHYCTDIDNSYPPNHGNDFGHDTHNGFFIRDDVPYLNFMDINNNKDHFNRPGISAEVQHKVGWVDESAFHSRYGGTHPNPPHNSMMPFLDQPFKDDNSIPRYPHEESQDQLVSIFRGLGLTWKYVPSLKSLAADELFRTVAWVGSDPSGNWLLRNPVHYVNNPLSPHCVYGVSPEFYHNSNANLCCDHGGAIFYVNAPPAVIAVSKTAGKSGFPPIPFIVPPQQVSAFQIAQIFGKTKDIAFTDCFVAIAKNWQNALGFNTSENVLQRHAKKNKFQSPEIPLMYKLFYPSKKNDKVGYTPENDQDGSYQIPSYENLLNSAPPCGPYYYRTFSWKNGPHYWNAEWSGNDRLNDYFHRADLGFDNVPIYNADFNGLDYMVLLNFYALVKENYLPKIFNSYYDDNYTRSYPESTGGPNGIIGSHSKKLKLNFLEYLNLNNTIESDGDVTFRGGKKIDLSPGFQSKTGSSSLIYIRDYNCAGGYHHDEQYHFAYLTNPIEQGIVQSEEDVPIEYGDNYIPPIHDSTYDDSLVFTTPEQDSIYVDSLLNVIYSSGDSFAIDYVNNMMDTTGDINVSFKKINKRFLGNYNNKDNKLTNSLNAKHINTLSGVLTIYPNPNTGTFIIELPDNGSYEIRVMNMVGSTVYETVMKNERKKEITLNRLLPAGNYTIQISNSNARYIEKLSVVR